MLKIDTPVMFSTFKVAYRLLLNDRHEDHTTIESAMYMKSNYGFGEVFEIATVGGKVVQQIPCE
jgi:hypothetical protein